MRLVAKSARPLSAVFGGTCLVIAYLSMGAFSVSGSLLIVSAIYGLFAISVAINFGWVGVPSFGQAAFFGIGAFTAALLSKYELDSAIVIVVAVGLAVAAALLIAVLALNRTTVIGFAIVTLAVGQILHEFAFRTMWLGGGDGLSGIRRGTFLGIDVSSEQSFGLYVILIFTVSMVFLALLFGSGLGHLARGVRINGPRISALGHNVTAVKLAMFGVAGGVSGLAGVLFAQYQYFISYANFSWLFTGTAIIMAIAGGVHSYWGPILGAFIYTFGQWHLSQATEGWEVLTGLTLIVIIMLAPGGLAGLGAQFTHRLVRMRSSGDPSAISDASLEHQVGSAVRDELDLEVKQ